MFEFFKKIFFINMIMIIVGIFPFLSWGKGYWVEILCAFSISLINAIVGYYLVLNSINKPNAEFYKFVYGGMLVRMAVVFGFSIFMILNGFVLKTPYMLFLISFYVIHQWTEISGWLKDLPRRKVQLNS
tara:strand:- start:128 stop:514 length:387 start_codon:yes stop_codon:yes gene_type:complete